MERKNYEKAKVSIFVLDCDDVITTSGDIAPWDPVNVNRGIATDMGNDAGIQGGAN